MPKATRAERKGPFDAAETLSEIFDSSLSNGVSSFTSEALFNRLIMELWQRRALGCLSMDRAEFTDRLEQRGWTYNSKTHLWSKSLNRAKGHDKLALF